MTVEFPKLFNNENRIEHEMKLLFPAEQETQQRYLYIPNACYCHEDIPSCFNCTATPKHDA